MTDTISVDQSRVLQELSAMQDIGIHVPMYAARYVRAMTDNEIITAGYAASADLACELARINS